MFAARGLEETMFDTDTRGPWTVVHPAGEIDLAVADLFRATVLEAFDLSNMVAIDFADVTFLDSSGIGVIAVGFKRAREQGGRLVLVGMAKPVRTVLGITGLDQIIEIRPTVDYLDGGRAAS
jgi:anti-sigma B factor antagonist